ncbi:MAG: 4-phosphopantoate--beta-alanine ligase, partial [Gammaproteobacteria bacterium]|nr:4-phosphopantoate--beta-alanine ligase [Gammaproteobacteria bacterium]
TVVVKLFNQVLPDIAVFGQKDYQQLSIIRQVVSDLDIPVTVHGAPTVRDEDGLAMSSRNRYLTTEQRQIAPLLYRLLTGIAHELSAGNRDFGLLCDKAMQGLGDAGFAPDYVEIRTPDLGQPQLQDREFVILGAARLGKARLIDNVMVSV